MKDLLHVLINRNKERKKCEKLKLACRKCEVFPLNKLTFTTRFSTEAITHIEWRIFFI